jgi:cytochrome c553
MFFRNRFKINSFWFVLALTALGLFKLHEIQAATNAVTLSPSTIGHIAFDESFFDFGTVIEGEVVKHIFKFKNDGGSPVGLLATETSCGCTTANAALKSYAPGEKGEMEVVIDTKGKKGIIVKTVTISLQNNQAATVELSMSMKLIPPQHPKVENVININKDVVCKRCHLESGVGQTGIFLYHRVCSQCHGKKGVGGSAKALNDEKWQQQITDEYLKQIIYHGQGNVGMPAFVEGVAPALTEEQMESLIKYIRSMKLN